ncbi:Uncharacterised protein [Legionella wadsworthii]|uniref:Uncharacterized protein n=1 Tax=Legionella wadsworthii TaxID=28088 RepID=A0A378LT09_9GAMM|nr:hypothetical protein [Legionella wadsworthii]STY28988.1 Uncharacterised protein [Legionella wadsworthii]
MQSKNDEFIPKVITTTLYAERVVINVANAAKHLFFPTAEEAQIGFAGRAQQEFKKKVSTVANDLTSIAQLK